MGVETESDLFTWEQIKPHVNKLNNAALIQLIDTWQITKDNTSDGVCWGDEVEYQIIKLHSESEEAHLCLQQSEILRQAESDESTTTFEWQPEFARFMAESNPTKPYTIQLEDLAGVATSMRRRRKELKSLLVDDADPFTLTLFPLLGSQQNKFDQNEEPQATSNDSSRFVPDNVISPRKRYTFLESNARARSNRPMVMKVPIFFDEKTPRPWRDPTLDSSETTDAKIFLEGTIFGPGACGLQVTMEARNRHEAYEIHDQLCALGPVMLALTANTPIFKGFLADTDARWNTISESFDDRTEDEMDSIAPRWSPCPMYLSPSCPRELYNATLPADVSIRERLESAGIEAPLAHFYSNFFKRSILLVNEDDLAESTTKAEPDLWTRLSGTIFPHVRLKMPQYSEGWRVEFRPMEVQFTDFENASCAIFVTLFRQAVVRYNLDFRLPIATVHKDIDEAHARDACIKSRFWWRRLRSPSHGSTSAFVTDMEPALCTIHEIINGTPQDTHRSGNPGLLHLVRKFVTEIVTCDTTGHVDPHFLSTLDDHLNFISSRASGKHPTGAHFTRNVVRSHPDYRHDSVVTTSICYELVKQVKSMMELDLMSEVK